MTTPADFARVYAQMFTWFWDGKDWVPRRAPIVNYLQHNDSKQDRRAAEAQRAVRALLPGATGMPHVNQIKTFNFNDYDYINNSIDRCFIGKARAKLYRKANVDGLYIAITFDDGPDAVLTSKLLGILKKNNVRATFFVVGRNAAKYPKIVNRILTEHHAIG